MKLPDFLPASVPEAFIGEPARRIPVLARCDVAVFGGGPAGVCAAVTAARMGKRVLLVERHGCLGGMATVANVNVWHSLYGTDSATRVIGGLAEEIIDALLRERAARNSSPDGRSGNWIICSETAKLVFDDLVIQSGVKLLLHTALADVAMEGERVVAAFVESKSGRHAIEAETFIDATGDADLVRRTGVPTQFGNGNGECQPPTLCFRIGGVGGDLDRPRIQAELFREPMDYNGEPYPCFLWGNPGIWDPGEQMLAGTRVPNTNVADTLDLTRAEVHARYQMRWVLRKLRAMPGQEMIHLRDIAAQIGVRESHRIRAEHALSRREVLEGVSFDDTIGQGTYPIDIHNPTGPGIIFDLLDGRRREVRGDASARWSRWDGQPEEAPLRETLCWQVPYRSLVPRDLANVLAAGRCIGADHEAAGATRVMVNAMQFGQAAGAAAALCEGRGAVRCVEPQRLRGELKAQGVPLLEHVRFN